MNNSKSHSSVLWLVGTAIFIAIVVILQLLGSFIRFGPFSISLVLLPIVVGAAVFGFGSVKRSALTGAILGFVFGLTVLLSGDAAAFLAVNPLGTVVTVLVKGAGCGAAAGAVYALIARKSEWPAVIVSAVVCPVVNTGIFLIGCLLFFMPTITGWAEASGLGGQVGTYMITGLVGVNFLVEMGINVVLSPVILRLIRFGVKK